MCIWGSIKTICRQFVLLYFIISFTFSFTVGWNVVSQMALLNLLTNLLLICFFSWLFDVQNTVLHVSPKQWITLKTYAQTIFLHYSHIVHFTVCFGVFTSWTLTVIISLCSMTSGYVILSISMKTICLKQMMYRQNLEHWLLL